MHFPDQSACLWKTFSAQIDSDLRGSFIRLLGPSFDRKTATRFEKSGRRWLAEPRGLSHLWKVVMSCTEWQRDATNSTAFEFRTPRSLRVTGCRLWMVSLRADGQTSRSTVWQRWLIARSLRDSFFQAIGATRGTLTATPQCPPAFLSFCSSFLSLCLSPTFHKEISRLARLETTIANSVDPLLHPRFCLSSCAFL